MTKKFIEDTFISPTGKLLRSQLKIHGAKSIDLYEVYNNATRFCKCGEEKTYYDFSRGFTKTCGNKKCIDSLIDYNVVDKAYITSHLLDINGKLNIRNIARVKESNEELYCIFNETKPSICQHKDCENTTEFLDFQIGYRNYCSVYCSHNSDEVKLNKVLGTLKSLGVENASQSEVIKQKKINTSLSNYGVEYPFQSSKVKKSMFQNNIDKYGHGYTLQTRHVKDKIKVTNIKKYGVENPRQNSKVIEKSRQTRIKNGNQIHPDDMTDFERYTYLVWLETNKHTPYLDKIELRGALHLDKNAHHVDHQYSIFEGFKNSILPIIVGGIKNLKVIPASENCKKNRHCSIKLEEI